MQKRISKTVHEYAGRNIAVGEEFDVEDQDVALLVAIGRIERTDEDPIPGYMTRDMIDNPTPIVQTVMTRHPRRQYERKVK